MRPHRPLGMREVAGSNPARSTKPYGKPTTVMN
jgi:hypothetical protein